MRNLPYNADTADRPETGEKAVNGERKWARQERSRHYSAERVHSLLTVPSAENAHARQAA
jgi:hypothetical protein